MRFRFDLHSHSFFSSDGVSRPEEMIAVAKSKGLDGLAITDHNNCDSVDYLLKEGLMREDGLPVDGFLMIPGVEVTTAEGHLLCLGVRLPDDLKGTPAEDVCRLTHEAGGIVIPPHPYDKFRAGIRESVLETLPLDAVEVFNAATTLDRHNRQARGYAKKKGLGMLASSDAHHASMIGTAHTLVEAEELTLPSVIKQIPNCYLTVERYQGFRACLQKTFANVRRLARRPR
ncbi:MAG: PHP domain-containing protein [Verrucomicrobiaceae bacterium]|jgi:predicted metal-dependent phosphoesterase TrpH|nr:PHP domain-containing protein [Verrucomicrobiales bacterium]MDF1785747.1 PHP domain-containing protein [Verrucomicrobiales bacterium]NCF84225.1 PHP domain-containing protein [Verrucomicrobiaceae bacterium]NCF92765.1 PHP domain-containing protein [Verrucomicrobiaceae bacterium]